MGELASLQPIAAAALDRPGGSALATLPRRQALWIGGQIAAALLAALFTLWASHPELGLTLSLAVGASLVNPKKLWAAPLVIAGVTLSGLLFYLAELPALIGAGAAAGALATWLIPQRTDWLDHVHGALGTVTGSSLGLWAAASLVPEALPTAFSAMMTAGIVGLVGSQGLLPVAIRFDQFPQVPTTRVIRRTLRVAYRRPVFKAVDLYRAARAQAPDVDTRRGLAEVATWVYRLQLGMQTLDSELDAIDPIDIQQRITTCEDLPEDLDPFTRDRRQATANHLRRLLEHRQAIEIERGRNDALVEYALAFLEEARAGLAVARELPGEAVPDRLSEVLDRLRSQYQEGDARRRTVREMGRISQKASIG